MAQADGVVANGTGSAVRADINGQLAALFTNHSGSTEPATTFAFQTWADTNTSTLKLRNSSNDGWIQLARLDGQFDAKTFNGNITLNAQSDLRLADSDSSNWVAFQAPATVASNVTWTLPAADGTSGQTLQTNGSGTLSWSTPSATVDKIEEGNTSAEVVDTGSDGHFKVVTEGTEALRVDSSQRVGIGTISPTTTVHAEDAQCELQLKSTSGTNSAGLRFVPGGQTNAWYIYANGSRNLVFDDHASERMRIDASGRLLVGTSSGTGNSGTKLVLHDSSNPRLRLTNSTTGEAASDGAELLLDGSNFIIENRENANILLYTNGSERMRIDSNGFVNIGAYTIPSATPGMQLYGAGNLIFCKRSDTGEAISFYANSTTKVGNIVLGASSTTYNTSSDYRLKENVVPLAGATDRLKQLPVHRFNFIVEPDKTVDGFLAHEAQAVVPEAISGVKDEIEVWKEGEELPDGVSVGDNKLDEDGNTIPVYQGIDQSKLVPLLTAALQEAIGEIESLKARVAALESA